jgi:acyl-coenzyme A thioesterase PaaI-like protein
MSLIASLAALRPGDPELPLDAIPYAAFLRLSAMRTGEGLILRMDYHPDLVGNPIPPRLHGGAVGGMLELACALTVMVARGSVEEGASPFPKPVNITIDYLRAGGVHDVFAVASITRLGRSIANVRAEAWQQSRDRLIATAQMNLLLG